jgi:hypothetical protein
MEENNAERAPLMGAAELDKFLSVDRDVFIRNVTKRQTSMSLGMATEYSRENWGYRPSILVPVSESWFKLMAPLELIRKSEDLLIFLRKGYLELWNPEDPSQVPEMYEYLTPNDPARSAVPPKEEPLEPPTIASEDLPEYCVATPALEKFSSLQFGDVLKAVEEENWEVLKQIDFHEKQIEFHTRSLEAAQSQFNEINPVYGVLQWLKDNVFDDGARRGLIRAALEGSEGDPGRVTPEKGPAYGLPSTYKTLLKRVKSLSMDGKFASFQARFPSKGGVSAASSDPVKKGKKKAPKKAEKKAAKAPVKKTRKTSTVKRGVFPCEHCDFVSQTANGLGAHKYSKHGTAGAGAAKKGRSKKKEA